MSDTAYPPDAPLPEGAEPTSQPVPAAAAPEPAPAIEPTAEGAAAAAPRGVSSSILARLRWRTHARLLVIVALSVGLAISLTLWGYYLTTRHPITKLLPGAQPVVARLLQPRYLFSINGVSEPVGVAVTANGDRIYVAESGGDRLVRAFDQSGKALFTFAPPDSTAASRSPFYVAVNDSGLVYVVDRRRLTIDTYDSGGNYKGAVASPFAEGWLPLGIRVDGSNLLVTETTSGLHRVLKLDRQGALTLQFGQEGKGENPQDLWFPNGAVADARGRIYVSDSDNGRVQVFDPGGKLLYSINGFSLPHGLDLDEYGRLHVVDTVGQEVKVYDVSGDRAALLFSFGTLGDGDGQFNYPNDIAIDGNDRVYVADRANNRVQVWAY